MRHMLKTPRSAGSASNVVSCRSVEGWTTGPYGPPAGREGATPDPRDSRQITAARGPGSKTHDGAELVCTRSNALTHIPCRYIVPSYAGPIYSTAE